MKKWVLILLMLLLTLPGYALITIEKKPGTGTLSGHLDDINANDLELDGKIDGKVSDDAFTSDWGEVTDVAPSQAALYNYLINFDADGDGLFSDEAWFPSIFDPAAPGEIGGTTPAAGSFTELTVGILTSTPVDGENRLTFPDNTTRSPAAGAQEIYSEGGLMKYSENGVEKRFITIDDTAGDGDTGVALSADKIVELIEAGGSGVPDGTSTDDILSWDGDSWEPVALTAHPAFSSLLAAFNNAGLNSFTFTPSVTYPIWAATSPVTVSFDVTDTSTTYAVADVDYQYDGAGGFVENMTNTTGDTWTADVTIATDGAHTIQLEAVDDKSPTPNSGQSAVYTINFDGTDPVVGDITPSALTHDGTGATLSATIASITEANENYRQWSLYDVTDAAIQTDWATFTGLSISGIAIPADQHTYRVDVRCYDLAGNVGTVSSANIVYQAAGVDPTYSWPCTDNAASTVVLSGVGGNSATLINAGNTSEVSLDGGFNIPDTAYVNASIPDTLWESGIFTIQGRFRVTRTIGTAWSYIFVDSSGSNQFTVLWAEDTHYVRLYTNGVDRGWSNVAIPLNDLTERYIRVTHNTNTASLYAGTDEGSLSLVYTWATSTAPTNAGAATKFGGNGLAGGTFKGKISGWKVWNTVVTP